MAQRINVPGMGIVEFPDGMSDDAMASAIKSWIVTSPGGEKYQVQAPAGASEADVMARVQQHHAGQPQPQPQPQEPSSGVGDFFKSVPRGMLSGLSSAMSAGGEASQIEMGQPVDVPSGQQTTGILEKNVTGELHKPEGRAGRYGATIGEFLGNPGSYVGPGGPISKIVTAILGGVGSEAAGQAAEGTKYEPAARMAGAAAAGLAPSVAGRVVTPLPTSAARQRLVDILSDEGVTSITAGQRTGRPALRYAESMLGDYPGAGSKATAAQGEAQAQFTQAAMRRAGAGPEATPEILAANNARLGNEFETLAGRNTLQFDPQFVQDASRAVRGYERVPASQQRATVDGYVTDIVDHMQQGGMPGTYYQEMRSRLSRQSNGLRDSDPTLSEALRDLRDSLDNAMRRSISPADREAWDTARQQYGAQKTIEKAASRAGEATAEGQVTPANLRNTAAAENRGAYARGQGQFSELARAGAGVMGQMPQSGTAPRAVMTALASGLAGGAGFLSGGATEASIAAALAAAGGPALAGRALMSRPVQGYLGNQVATPVLNRLHPSRAALINALVAAAH